MRNMVNGHTVPDDELFTLQQGQNYENKKSFDGGDLEFLFSVHRLKIPFQTRKTPNSRRVCDWPLLKKSWIGYESLSTLKRFVSLSNHLDDHPAAFKMLEKHFIEAPNASSWSAIWLDPGTLWKMKESDIIKFVQMTIDRKITSRKHTVTLVLTFENRFKMIVCFSLCYFFS